MPRLPTMRVIGSQAISTTWLPSAATSSRRSSRSVTAIESLSFRLPTRLVASDELATGLAPLGFLIDRMRGYAPQRADDSAIGAARGGRDARARRLVHER